MMHQSTSEIRKVIQLVELQEFASQLGMDYRDNKVIDKWIEDGHAQLFAEHFDKVKGDISAHCHARCGSTCQDDPMKCKLRQIVHTLMRDKRNW